MKRIFTIWMIAALMVMTSAMAEDWAGTYTCVTGGVTGFDPMGDMIVIYEGDRYEFTADISLVASFVIYSVGNKDESTFEVTGTMSEMNDDYQNVDGLYLNGTMTKSGSYIDFTVRYSDGSEVRPGDHFVFVKD